MLQSIDADIVDVASVPFTAKDRSEASSLVELEWTGRTGTLEGRGSRGAHATSADACLIGVTATGRRRLYLIECKYTERYDIVEDSADPRASEARRLRWEKRNRERHEKQQRQAGQYRSLYATPSSCLSGAAPLDEVLFDPIYQIVRLGMLADASCADTAMGVAETRVVVMCPAENVAYRERITSPALARRFPNAPTIEQMARQLWRDPAGVAVVDPRRLVDAVRAVGSDSMSAWSTYLRDRYGW
jgi:hypothetical protein